MTDDAVQMLLCEPRYFSIDYEINPWMNVNVPVDPVLAWNQWTHLREILIGLGVQIHLIEPIPGLPDMVFTGDAGVVLGKRFVSSSFRPKERRPEADYFRKWFESRGYEVRLMPDGVFFEGFGDIVFHGRTGIVAYGQRTSAHAIPYIRACFEEITWREQLELVSPKYFHLGISLSLLDDSTGLFVPEAFSETGRNAIQRMGFDMIAVSDDDAVGFAVNVIVVGRTLVTNFCSDALRRELEGRNFEVIVCDVSEFLKSGGGTRCLVLPFYR